MEGCKSKQPGGCETRSRRDLTSNFSSNVGQNHRMPHLVSCVSSARQSKRPNEGLTRMGRDDFITSHPQHEDPFPRNTVHQSMSVRQERSPVSNQQITTGIASTHSTPLLRSSPNASRVHMVNAAPHACSVSFEIVCRSYRFVTKSSEHLTVPTPEHR